MKELGQRRPEGRFVDGDAFLNDGVQCVCVPYPDTIQDMPVIIDISLIFFDAFA